MREIKFRAWDKTNHNMLQINSLFTEYSNESDLRFAVNGARFPIMQYTGLKDKSGKEIFEGDIIEGRRHNYPVTYLQSEARFESTLEHSYVPTVEWEEYEVIGNIYENPELLERGR